MQSWCPREFDLESEHGPVLGADDPAGPTPEAVVTSAVPFASGTAGFRRDAGYNDPGTILNHMSPQERAVVFELVELEVAAQYERREQKWLDEQQAKQEAETNEFRAATRTWAAEFSAQRDMEMRDLAAACARLALDLAEKLVRGRVADDPEVVVRAVETALRAGDMGGGLTVTAAPEDAAWLEADDELRDRLGIARVVADRRISRGGCQVADGNREWNATLEGQLATLGEVIEEWIVTESQDQDMGDEPGGDPGDAPVE